MKGPDNKYFVGHEVSVATAQLWCPSEKAVTDNTKRNELSSMLIKLDLQKQALD